MYLTKKGDRFWLDLAHTYATKFSGCSKVQVGSLIVIGSTKVIGAGANTTDLGLCKKKGCLREEKYGDNSKTHRNPDDCRAIHSEISAICEAAKYGRYPLRDTTIYVTRYPCEACARAIVRAKITRVVYGREQEISEMTKELFRHHNVEVVHIKESDKKDVLT